MVDRRKAVQKCISFLFGMNINYMLMYLDTDLIVYLLIINLKQSKMTQEELKTCLGQLLLDLRGNWAFDYSNRLNKAHELCNQINDFTEDVKRKIEQELTGDYDGRTFRNASFYGYASDEGITEEVKKWLEDNLSHPEYCSVLND